MNMKTGEKFTVWQKIENDTVVAHVDASDKPVKMPKIYEATVVEDELERPE